MQWPVPGFDGPPFKPFNPEQMATLNYEAEKLANRIESGWPFDGKEAIRKIETLEALAAWARLHLSSREDWLDSDDDRTLRFLLSRVPELVIRLRERALPFVDGQHYWPRTAAGGVRTSCWEYQAHSPPCLRPHEMVVCQHALGLCRRHCTPLVVIQGVYRDPETPIGPVRRGRGVTSVAGTHA